MKSLCLCAEVPTTVFEQLFVSCGVDPAKYPTRDFINDVEYMAFEVVSPKLGLLGGFLRLLLAACLLQHQDTVLQFNRKQKSCTVQIPICSTCWKLYIPLLSYICMENFSAFEKDRGAVQAPFPRIRMQTDGEGGMHTYSE